MLQCSLIDRLSDKDKQILYSITNGVMINDHIFHAFNRPAYGVHNLAMKVEGKSLYYFNSILMDNRYLDKMKQ